MPEDDDLPRLLSGGRYRLEASIGHGGMGVVYRGIDLTMQRPIAVKLIRAVDGIELDEETASRFLREAKNTARLQHENIIDVFDLGRDQSGLYFVMELLEGESLSARIRREGRILPADTVHIGKQICDALEVAHAGGIIHRDLKPANVMLLSRAGDDNFVKVLDFGVAKSYANDQDTQLTHTGMLVGTVDYMAPEQIMGKLVDGRTDIYALGVVLYRMLCGKNPFREPGVPALIHAHLNTMPTPLTEMVEGIPNELDHIVLRCLAKKPERRFESMAELARALAGTVRVAPLPLLNLEYSGDDDDDQAAVKTTLARSFEDDYDNAQDDGGARDVPQDATYNERVRDHGTDATLHFDRPAPRRLTSQELGIAPSIPRLGLKPPEPGQRLPPPPPARITHAPLGPPVLYPEDVSTQKRQIADEVRRIDPRSQGRTCAMCQTVNAAHARSCMACGVSLAYEDQEAVRDRVRSGAGIAVQPPPPPPVPPAPPSSQRNGSFAPSFPTAPPSSARNASFAAPHSSQHAIQQYPSHPGMQHPPSHPSGPQQHASHPSLHQHPSHPSMQQQSASHASHPGQPSHPSMQHAPSGPYGMPSVPPSSRGQGSPMQGAVTAPPWLPPPPPAPPSPPSAWDRFLLWTGIRGR